MKGLKFFVVALSLAAAVLLASNCYAQNQAPLFNAVGSSASFNAFALAARISNPGGQSGVCGDHNWTKKSGTATGIDNRSNQIAAAGGQIWIVWNDTAEPNRTVCAYLQVDSVVGNRLFFAMPQGSLSLPSSAIGENGDQIVPLLPPDEALPQNIYNDINNAVFNAAPTDIRSEDAKFATTRALAPLNTKNYNGLGYGPGPIGANILSAFSSKSAQVVDFSLTGKDPITGETVVPAYETNVGAQVALVLVNTTDTNPGGLGNSYFNNVDRFTLGYTLSGQLSLTRDLIPSAGLPSVPLDIITREPISGTMNTVEFSLTRSLEVGSTQELGVNPSSDNPLNLTLADGAKRQRAIGTGEEVSEIGSNADSIGYSFFSFGNVQPVLTTAKYLTVDGVDPLQAAYTGGTLPQCNAPCPGQVTFPNVVNGSYAITAAEQQVANIPDFVPFTSMQMFRSHYPQSGIPAKNGHKGRTGVEEGGDVGGAVFPVQADLDLIADTGVELIGLKQ
jgi:hypothetical protein